jgi:hypothetical protein
MSGNSHFQLRFLLANDNAAAEEEEEEENEAEPESPNQLRGLLAAGGGSRDARPSEPSSEDIRSLLAPAPSHGLRSDVDEQEAVPGQAAASDVEDRSATKAERLQQFRKETGLLGSALKGVWTLRGQSDEYRGREAQAEEMLQILDDAERADGEDGGAVADGIVAVQAQGHALRFTTGVPESEY